MIKDFQISCLISTQSDHQQYMANVYTGDQTKWTNGNDDIDFHGQRQDGDTIIFLIFLSNFHNCGNVYMYIIYSIFTERHMH